MNNFADARCKSIAEYLAKAGYRPRRVTEKHLWYCSPFRTEGHPSFTINRGTNRWKDRGDNSSGSIIDLVMKMESCTLQRASEILQSDDIKIDEFKPVYVPRVSIEVIASEELLSEELLEYMRSRGITDDLSKKYCRECYYVFYKEGRVPWIHKAVGFANTLGGYQLRGPEAKYGTKPHSYSCVGPNTKNYVIVEGFFDFLSFMTHYNLKEPKLQTYILNGTGMINVILPFLEGRKGYAYVDNDHAGDDVILASGAVDMRGLYKEYNDFNEFLCSKK